MQGGGRQPHIMEIKKMEEISEIIGGLEECSDQRRKVYDKNKVSPTLQAAMGMGGGCVPFITEEIKVLGNYMPSNHDASRVVDAGGGSSNSKGKSWDSNRDCGNEGDYP